jgi:hypothetical protein
VVKKPLKKTIRSNNNICYIGKIGSKARIIKTLERVFKISKKGVSEFISIDKTSLRKKGCKSFEIDMFQSNNGVPYLRRESPICRKYIVERKYSQSSGALIGFKLIGFNKTTYFSRHIPQKIRQDVLKKYDHKCILCGSKDRLEVDHKNGRYDTKTDKVSDFQILCKSCNDKKRERCNKCRESGCRYNVQKEVSSILYKSDFTSGTGKYNEKQGCKGCFLYDIEDFYKNHDKKYGRNHQHEINLVVKTVQPKNKNTKVQGRVILKQKIVLN